MNPTLARLRRLLVMVPWLLDHPGVPVAEVAERFDTTPKDVMDDLDVLGYCGLPGYGGGDLVQATVSGGNVVVRMAEFFSRPLALSVREGLALLMAARATRDSGLLREPAAALDSAITKLEAHLGDPEGLPVALDVQAGGAELLERLLPALSEPRVVTLTYRSGSKDETTERSVEPWAVRSLGGAWYLQGHCRLADAPRAFRLDRILALEVTDEVAPPPPSQPLQAPVYRPRPEDPLVVLDVDPSAAWISDQVVLESREVAEDGWIRLTFRASTLDWAARLALQLGSRARVVTPGDLAERIERMARSALVNYGHM